MGKHIALPFFILLSITLHAQNVGVGTTNPQDLLHIKDGQLRLEGNNKFFNFHTNTPSASGIRFYTDNVFKGAWFYRGSDQTLNLTSNGNIDGLIYRLGDNKMLFGRDFTIGSERFGIRSTTNSWGGMYIETSGENGKPFYGYATDSIGRAYHYYDGATSTWRLYNIGDRLTVTNTGNIGIGTITPAEKLHLLGNLRLDGGSPLLQFYQQGVSKAQIRHNSTSFYLNNIANGSMYFQTNNGTKMTITGSGDVGIGTITPEAKLQVYGNQWDLSSTDGIMMIGADAQRMVFGVAIDGLGAGTGRIYSKGANNRLILGGGTNDVLSVLGDTKRVGIGTNDPAYTLDIKSNDLRGLDILNSYNGSSSKYGARIEANGGGTGSRYGIYSLAYGTSGATASTYAGRFLANGSGNTGSVFGIYAQVSAPGTGNHYGIYTTASTSNPSATTRSWALFAQGHSYFSSDVRIGTLDGAAGYRLSVNGKIMSEELKVQMSENWPDYVFEEEYDLMSLEEIDRYIKQYKHLPGVPSAKEVKTDNGFYVGEMNRVLLEKVEELTLLLIQQNQEIMQLKASISSIKKEGK